MKMGFKYPIRYAEPSYEFEDGSICDYLLEEVDGIEILRRPRSPEAVFLSNAISSRLRAILPPNAFLSERGVIEQANSYTRPNLAVFPGNFRDYAQAHPRAARLIVEVAEEDGGYEITTKARIYADFGAEEYLAIVPVANQVHRFCHPESFGYSQHQIFVDKEGVPVLGTFIGADTILNPPEARN
ncbi:hypothetical protein BH11ARM2_BH11ARM2_06580 [soil metagenome]